MNWLAIALSVCTPQQKWAWDGPTRAPTHPYTCTTPLVGQLSDDNRDGRIDLFDVPDVVFTHCANYDFDCRILVLDGLLGGRLIEIGSPAVQGQPALADIDGDGVVEILAKLTSESRIVAFEHDGTFKWQSDPLGSGFDGGTSLGVADLDQDGSPEIIAGTRVFSSDGRALWQGLAGAGCCPATTHAVDLLAGSPGLEVLAGQTLYDAAGNTLWTSPLRDGLTAVLDVDGDGAPEILLAPRDIVADAELWLMDRSGNPMGAPHVVAIPNPGRDLVRPVVADLDGDGSPEVVVVGDDEIEAVEWNGSGFTRLWTASHLDTSGRDGAIAFDLDGDRAAEVLYHDQENWYVIDGRTGAKSRTLPFPSVTLTEIPAVADLDNDCEAEILIAGCGEITLGYRNGVAVYDCPGAAPARAIWNQLAYHVTNVAADGGIPRVETPPWRAGAGWLAQSGFDGGAPVADAGAPRTICAGQAVQLDGAASLPCPGTTLEYEWRVGAAPVCPRSPASRCDHFPAGTTTYTLEVYCMGGRACLPGATATVLVTVELDVVPADLGNTLRAVKADPAVTLSWGATAFARDYLLRRGDAKGAWPGPPLLAGAPTTATVPDLPPPPPLYFYRAAGASCSGREGP